MTHFYQLHSPADDLTKPLYIQFLTTGGSIDKTYAPGSSTFEIVDPALHAFLKQSLVAFKYDVTVLMKKDSLDLTDEDRSQIRRAVEGSGASRIVITHGTDTLVETGLCLHGIASKTIVLTGAFQPLRLVASDAMLNLGMAVGAVQLLPPGVYAAINGRVLPVERIEKVRSKQQFRVRTVGNGADVEHVTH